MALNPPLILEQLCGQASGRPLCVAYSGGVDSHVLLHLLATTSHPQKPPIRAIYIDHGLSPHSVEWGKHCAEVAAQLGVEFEALSIEVTDIDSLGLEAAARQARYQAFRETLSRDELLLTAQHQQDQAETLLLQLLRGAGPTGLSAMWPFSENDGLSVIRPLLAVSKDDIVDYARRHQLNWIDDPSNDDTGINRNYLRKVLWPEIEARWPALNNTLSRSASHCRETVGLLHDLADLDSQTVLTDTGTISLLALTSLPEQRQRNFLRYEIERRQLPLPSTVILQRIIDEVCLARIDGEPEVNWPGAIVRRYRDSLYIEAQPSSKPELSSRYLSGSNDEYLEDGRKLSWQLESGQGLKQHVVEAGLMLRFREGGEKIRLQGHAQHKSLKHLFQEWGIPPWQRASVPLFFQDGELVAVVGYGYAEGYAADIGEKGWLPQIEQVK